MDIFYSAALSHPTEAGIKRASHAETEFRTKDGPSDATSDVRKEDDNMWRIRGNMWEYVGDEPG